VVTDIRRDTLAVTALCLVQFVDVLGVTVVVTALPSMLASLRAPASAGGLLSTGYAMFFGGLLMLGARLGERFGHRRAVLWSLAGFAVGSVLAAVADSIVTLTAARCVQGAAAAAAVPSALRLLTTITPDGEQRRRAIAAWSASGAAAGASGFVVGGVVTELTSWRVIFWAYLPLMLALSVAVLRWVPRDGGVDRSTSLNVAGSAGFTGTVMAVIVGMTLVSQNGHRLLGTALLAVAVLLALGFVQVDRRAAAPLLPAGVRQLTPLRWGAIGASLNTATTSSVMTLATLYLQQARHFRPLAAAGALLPFSLAVVLGATLAAPALRRYRSHQVAATGLAAIAVADSALTVAARHDIGLPACVAVAGLGIGLSSVATTTLGTAVATMWRSTASGILNTSAQVGTAIGIAVLLLIATATTGTTGHGTTGPVVAWACAAAVAAVGAIGFARAGSAASAR
jgi:MFS family permease